MGIIQSLCSETITNEVLLAQLLTGVRVDLTPDAALCAVPGGQGHVVAHLGPDEGGQEAVGAATAPVTRSLTFC